MSVAAHVLRVLAILLGGVFAAVAVALLLAVVKLPNGANVETECGNLVLPSTYNAKECAGVLQARAEGAQAFATVALGAFVVAAAVSIGSRHRLVVRHEGDPRPYGR